MSDLNETPKDSAYAQCDFLGYDKIKKQIEDNDKGGFSQRSFKYAHSWLKKEEEKRAQEQRMNKTVAAALASAVASIVSAIIALIALCVDR